MFKRLETVDQHALTLCADGQQEADLSPRPPKRTPSHGRDVMSRSNDGHRMTETILLRGGQFLNKGDELMLHAVLHHFRPFGDRIRLVAHRLAGNYKQRASLGLHQHLWRPNVWSVSGTLGYLMLHRYRKSFGLVPESEIDAILDFSGFAYGDQWGPRDSQLFAKLSSKWRREGKKVIMLPQAFGSFTDARCHDAVRRIVDNCDLIFARDQKSYLYLTELAGSHDHIKVAPDFTNLMAGRLPSNFDAERKYACIVPNHWMWLKKSQEERASYCPALRSACKTLRANGVEPILLLHAPHQDKKLVAAIQELVSRPLAVVWDEDPFHLKYILGKSQIVVGSRYHALAGALSQAVPVVAFGWSHKYEGLLRDYDCSDCLLDVKCEHDQIVALIEELLRSPTREARIATLQEAACRQESLARNMWSLVDECLQIRPDVGFV